MYARICVVSILDTSVFFICTPQLCKESSFYDLGSSFLLLPDTAFLGHFPTEQNMISFHRLSPDLGMGICHEAFRE